MIFRSDALQKVKLIMFEKVEMPESEMKENEKTGKKEFIKTGKKVEMTSYTFRDAFGDKLVLLSKNNEYRNLEGETVDIEVELKHNAFTNKTQVSLAQVRKAQQQTL